MNLREGFSAGALAVSVAASFVVLGRGGGSESGELVINEVLVRNRLSTFDEAGDRAPWVELYNGGTRALDLSRFSLSDDPTIPSRWSLPPRELPPGDYFLVWCSGKTGVETGASEFHTGCELGTTGQTLLLSGPNGILLDALVLPPQTEDRSYARSPDGTGDFLYHVRPTPGSRNDGVVSHRVVPARPLVEPRGGRYRERIEVSVSAEIPVEGLSFRYTLDGSPPESSSELYEGPILFEPTSWWPGRVLRVAAFAGDERVSLIRTESYVLGDARYELPILSVSMEPVTFREVHYHHDRRGREAEGEGYLEVIDADGRRRAGVGMGLRLHGQTSRFGPGTMRKSYRIYFRDAYGAGRLRYPLIPDAGVESLERIVLRAGNDDAFRGGTRATYLRDQLLRELHADMGALVASGAWYNLFVNMEPRGVYNVAERVDANFLRAHRPGESADWDVIHDGEVVEGDRNAWSELGQLVWREGLEGDALHDAVGELVDLENFTDYMILNIWAQNHDWPHKNFFAVRARRPGARWFFLSWDAEMSLGLYPETHDADTFERARVRGGSILAETFAAIMKSPTYRDFFVSALERHLQGALAPANVLARLERIERRIGHDMRMDLATRFSPERVADWERNYRDVVDFVRRRGDVVREHVMRMRAPE